MNEQAQQKSDFKPEWKVDHTLQSKDDPVVIQVWKSNHRTPHYRLSVAFKGRDGKLVPSLSLFSESGVVITNNPTIVLSARFIEAYEYAVKEIEKNEAEWQAAHPRRDQDNRPGLKSLGKQDRENWEKKGRPERRRG